MKFIASLKHLLKPITRQDIQFPNFRRNVPWSTCCYISVVRHESTRAATYGPFDFVKRSIFVLYVCSREPWRWPSFIQKTVCDSQDLPLSCFCSQAAYTSGIYRPHWHHMTHQGPLEQCCACARRVMASRCCSAGAAARPRTRNS